MLEGSDKLARDAFVHSVKVFTSLVLFYAFIINYNITFIFSAHTSQPAHRKARNPLANLRMIRLTAVRPALRQARDRKVRE